MEAAQQPVRPSHSQRGGARRKPVSCIPCRRHKLRCDRHIPCATCTRYRRENECRLDPVASDRGLRARRKQADRSPVRQRQPTPLHNGGQQQPSRDAAAEAVSVRRGDGGSEPGTAHDSRDWMERELAQKLRRLAQIGSAEGPPAVSLAQLLVEASRQGSDHAMWRSALLDAPDRDGAALRRHLQALLPTRAQCDLLCNFFLDHINWIFQTIHVPTFRREYAAFWEAAAGGDLRPDNLIWASLLLSILSLGALYAPLQVVPVVGIPSESVRALAHLWHQASQKVMQSPDLEARPSLQHLQNFSITQLYWYATNRIDILNVRMAVAIRQAQALGLDKCTTASRTYEDEMRHRLWWDLVDSDMFQSMCLDRAPLIRLQSPGVPLPLNCDDGDLEGASLRPRPLHEPTVMSMNILRARVFQILNHHFHDVSSSRPDAWTYERVCRIDADLLGLMDTFPWYFQNDQDGNPPDLHASAPDVAEVLAWQHYILRTCIGMQRIRMFRPFLTDGGGGSGGAWSCCVNACRDAVSVYATLRRSLAPTSRSKFLPQAYQVFSVAVTVATLLLVEGELPLRNALGTVREMAQDLAILEAQGCPVPVATNGRRVLLRLLALCELRAGLGPASAPSSSPQDEARELVPAIATVLGGERSTAAYIDRLARVPTRDEAAAAAPTAAAAERAEGADGAVDDEADLRGVHAAAATLAWDGGLEGLVMPWQGEDVHASQVFDWDMSGMLFQLQG